ncbi:hypothetical protein BDZ94DRAFT_1254233 [Collybia nuda]|uniref:Zn(2)-C6 fungal-type domain-containing protein n=1 Tax=Collybia nuda TaxID=64659 RepID=A0A9P5YAW0_9AGAR|nr:hypothetical protein BDZ94DRAFT_1254233 [Collybia nuda]
MHLRTSTTPLRSLPFPLFTMMPSDSFQPLQLKGEIMDLEFTLDTDHRKRRRNRTTQSCLNCHTSKRKCDRKRPCQRCIQLGLTGLCVYEIDDPALRDDPSIDESTRLRNRIAELESLVRELRGKPHPRWAESNFRDGDPNEKWHSRATKCVPLSKRRGQSPDRLPDLISSHNGRAVPSLLSPIKTEPTTEFSPNLHRFSPSPAPSMRYHTFQADVRSPSSSSFDTEQHSSYNGASYPTTTSPPSAQYHNGTQPGSIPSSYSDGGGHYHLSGSDDGHPYHSSDHYSNGSQPQNFCPCRTSPGTGVAYISLAQQLQSSLNSLRQFSHHPPNTTCVLYRRILELNSIMQYVGAEPTDAGSSPYESNMPDREILTPLSASSGHTSFHTGSSGGVSPQEWNTLAAAGYNPYFPVHNEHGIYNHVIT